MLSFSATVGDQGRVRAVTTPSPSPSLLPGGQGRVPGQLQDDQAPGYVRDQCRHAKVEQAAAHARVRGTRLPPSTNLFLTTGYWLLTADYYWLLATCSLLLATCCLLLATCYLLLATCYLLQAESVIDLFPLLAALPREAPDGGDDPARRHVLP